MENNPSIITRRGFLRSMGLVVGAVVVAPAVLVDGAVRFHGGKYHDKASNTPMTYYQLASYEAVTNATLTLAQMRKLINETATNKGGNPPHQISFANGPTIAAYAEWEAFR